MGDKPISFKDENGNYISAADVWNAEKLTELFTRLNPSRKFRLEREEKLREQGVEIEDNTITDNVKD